MRLIVAKDYNDVSHKAANIIAAQIQLKPDCVLGLATGSSPVGTYKELIAKCAKETGAIVTAEEHNVLGGLGGAYITLGQLGYFQEDIVSGKGYIALVAVILGRRNPAFILLSAMLIGFAESLQFSLQAQGIPLPSQAFSMLPYVVAVLVLMLSIGKNVDPSALGVPYERDKR